MLHGGLPEVDMSIFGIKAYAPTQDWVGICVVDLELIVYVYLDVCSPNLDAIIVPSARHGVRSGLSH